MHCIELTPHREYMRGISSDTRIETVHAVVNHITSLHAIHFHPEHERDRGRFICTKVTLIGEEYLFVTETPQQIQQYIFSKRL